MDIFDLPAHKFFSKNTKGRDFFVGDIHGMYSTFMYALEKVDFNFELDRVFSVGDLIDRGNESFKCLLLSNEKWFIPVLGNHEKFVIDTKDNDSYARRVWRSNGGEWFEHLSDNEKVLSKKAILENFYLTLSVETAIGIIGVVHAQYPLDNWPITHDEYSKEIITELLWGRDVCRGGQSRGIKNIDFLIAGHTPMQNIKLDGNLIYIDTGCGYLPSNRLCNPHLTLCEFIEGKGIEYSFANYHFSKSIFF